VGQVMKATGGKANRRRCEGFKQVDTTPDCGVKGSGIPAIIMEKVIW
jgi:hypothetical protein